MTDIERRYQTALYKINVYKQQMESIRNEIAHITKTLTEILASKSTLRGLNDKSEIVLPIGGGAFIKGMLSTGEIIIRIGGGYLISVSKEKAIEELKKREEAMKKLLGSFTKEEKRLYEELGNANIELANIQSEIAKQGKRSA